MIIAGKTIVITGASDGIGRSIALRLATEKTKLVLLGRDQDKLDAVAAECSANGASEVSTFAFDLTDDSARQKYVAEVASSNLDVLINNAGIWHKSTPMGELDEATIRDVIGTNLTAQMLITNQLVADMKTRESAIVNIVSSARATGSCRADGICGQQVRCTWLYRSLA